MDKRTSMLLSTIFFGVAIVAYILYFMSKMQTFLITAIVGIVIGSIFNFISKRK